MTKSARGFQRDQSAAVDRPRTGPQRGSSLLEVVLAWLTSTRDQAQHFTALLPATQAGALPAAAFGASDPARLVDHAKRRCVGGDRGGDGDRSAARAARRFYQVPVTVTGGTVAALTVPTPVAGPPVAAVPGVDYPIRWPLRDRWLSRCRSSWPRTRPGQGR